jgi:serine/threonine protein kinase
MGNCNFKVEKEKESFQGKISSNKWLANSDCVAVNKNHFHFQYVIGRGGFGKVWRVEHRKQRKIYAMKEMSKARIICKRSV